MILKSIFFALSLFLAAALSSSGASDIVAIDADDPKVLMKQAAMYLRGQGVETDVAKAMDIYRGLAERDIAFAQFKLAQLYLEGKHLSPDHARAVEWLKRAAGLGLVEAQLELSRIYELGLGTEPDYVAAHIWLHVAESLGEQNLEQRRQALEDKMSYWQRTKANYLGRRCVFRKYEDC